MDIPQIPTDNLYKFKAIVGVVLALSLTGFTVIKVTELRIQVIEVETQLEKKKIQSERIAHELDKLQSKPQKTVDEVDLIKLKIDQSREQTAELKGNFQKMKFHLRDLYFIFILGGLGIAFGIGMARIGFREWYQFVQVPQDTLLRLQVELAEREANAEKLTRDS